MACFNETGDKRSTDQDPLRSRPAPAAADGQTLPPPPPPPQAVCFDCSICLDPAVDPVVTLCGHLYCWPCLYKWMQAETSSPKPQQCPVCKAPVSENAIVPLYGRGSLLTKHKSHLDVPARPNGGSKLRFLVPPPNDTRNTIAAASMMEGQQQPRLHYGHYTAPQWGGTSMLGSTAGGGLLLGLASVAVHPLMSRSSYSTRRPYHIDADAGSRSPRERRREMMVEESLRQIWTFLFCGAVLCLLFF